MQVTLLFDVPHHHSTSRSHRTPPTPDSKETVYPNARSRRPPGSAPSPPFPGRGSMLDLRCFPQLTHDPGAGRHCPAALADLLNPCPLLIVHKIPIMETTRQRHQLKLPPPHQKGQHPLNLSHIIGRRYSQKRHARAKFPPLVTGDEHQHLHYQERPA